MQSILRKIIEECKKVPFTHLHFHGFMTRGELNQELQDSANNYDLSQRLSAGEVKVSFSEEGFLPDLNKAEPGLLYVTSYKEEVFLLFNGVKFSTLKIEKPPFERRLSQVRNDLESGLIESSVAIELGRLSVFELYRVPNPFEEKTDLFEKFEHGRKQGLKEFIYE